MDEPPMKTALLILAVVAVLLLLTVFLRSRHSTHLDVTPDARGKTSFHSLNGRFNAESIFMRSKRP